jgi:transmembrane sensor
MESREEIEEAAATWIARRDLECWTEADATALQAWLAQSVSHRAAYYRLNAAWEESGRLRAFGHTTIDTNLNAGKRRLQPAAWQVALAASIFFVTLVVTAWYLWPSGPSYKTAVGGLASVPLQDGSRITLNTDSELRIRLEPAERRIDLSRGEAFFEVAKDPSRPFVVHAGNKRIIAVGTQFSVRRDGEDIRVSVSEGIVRIEPGSAHAQPVSLPAGTVARTESDNILVQKKSAPEIEQSLSWRTGVLTFRDTLLADAATEFNRYNTRKIVIADPAIAAIRVGGVFRATNLDPFVHLIEDGFAVKARAEGDRIILTAK